MHAIDFFCSAGGVTCGFKQAGINVLGGIDIDPSCENTYKINNDVKFLLADVSNLEKEVIAKYFQINRNEDDLIFVGCSPCQYYSNIKTDKTKSKKSRLLLVDFQEFVEFYRPGYVFVENVPGLETKKGSPLRKFKTFLTRSGYVFDERVVNAKYFGVPQNRRRYVLIASRVLSSIQLPCENKTNLATVRSAIGDLNKFPEISHGTKDTSPFLHSSAMLSSINLERIKNTPKNGGSRLDWKQKKLQPACYSNHLGHTDVYGRMHWDQPAPTITTRFISYSNGRYGHPEQDRAISLREGATLQSFPDNYTFYSNSQGKIAKMIGNAVPPLLAKAVGEHLNNLQKQTSDEHNIYKKDKL